MRVVVGRELAVTEMKRAIRIRLLLLCTVGGCGVQPQPAPAAHPIDVSDTELSAETRISRVSDALDMSCDGSDAPAVWSRARGEPIRGVIRGRGDRSPVFAAQVRLSRLVGLLA